MVSRSTPPLARLVSCLVALIFAAHVAAASVLVHPFDSQDVLLGVAVADEVANSLTDRATVIGPEAAPGAIPPLVAEGGFISLSRVVGTQPFTGAAGADLLRSGTGVDIAVTGSIEQRDSGYTLQLAVAHPGGLRTAELQAPADEPERLSVLAGALIDSIIDRQLPDTAPGESGPYRPPSLTGSFDDAYGGYVRAVALVGAGLLEDALTELEAVAAAEGAPPRAAALRDDLLVLLGGGADEGEAESIAGAAVTDASRLARRAILSVSSPQIDPVVAAARFAAMKDATGLALADAWHGALAASVNDRAGAQTALAEAAAGYDYGAVVYASFLFSRGAAEEGPALAELVADGAEAGSAALLGASILANLAGDSELEEEALVALSRASPFLTYPLEHLSYLYFDREDARSAAEVLAVAIELAPESGLYWTNLGWAYYLLGSLELSEEASNTALSLDGSQEVAAYNLGLVMVVTGRLEEAMAAYQRALRLDPEVNDEAVEDLENARARFPGEPTIEYAVAVLYEAEGRRSDARSAFRRYLGLADDGEPGSLVQQARDRLAVLEAPLPPLEVSGELTLNLGQRGPAASPFHPGDPLYPSFELTTPGDQLPTRVTVTASLRPADTKPDDAAPLAEATVDLEIPAGAVGYVVDALELTLPADLASGAYLVVVEADGGEEQRVELTTELSVEGEPELLRRLIGRGLVMTSFQSGAPLYSAQDLAAPDQLTAVMLDELAASATA
ncbi:MAG TPA: tetratricopeptide repeat protein, partial [Trueperaceae bacterium]|nr:tetratricopeptide repeat protein [Trueperaceae bacterium]